MAKQIPVPDPPAYLGGTLLDRWAQLAPELAGFGVLDDLNADLLAKYILAENNYLQVSHNVQEAIAGGDADEAGKWLAAQDKLTKQILALGAELGITPRSRRERALIR